MVKDLKYLAALTIPLVTYYSLNEQGLFAYSTVIFIFILLPIVEYFGPQEETNISPEAVESYNSKRFFDWMLYLNVPIVYFFVFILLNRLTTIEADGVTTFGWILSTGIVFGALGINVAHELGHKSEPLKQLLAKILLLPSFYMHFFIEHNLGHHKHVATEKDPASARQDESVYFFWIRSLVGSYLSAWDIQNSILKRKKKGLFSWSNQMMIFTLVQLLFLCTIIFFCGASVALQFLGASLVAILLLESINYIEHYGLRRALLPNGKYERVQPKHSWNSNHHVGRIILYELTRHSDHHFLAHKKYQVLDHHEDAKQLPFGYPASILLSLVPPLWFRIINPKLECQ